MTEPKKPFVISSDGKTTDEGHNYFGSAKFGSSGGGNGGSGMDHDLIDAKIEAARAQNDARFAEVMAGIKILGNTLDLQKELLTQTKNAAERAEQASDAAQKSAANVKWNIAFTALGVIGVVFVVWQLWMQGVEMTAGLLSTVGTPQDGQ